MKLQLSDPTLLKSMAYIDGEWRPAANGSSFTVKNPATGEVIADVTDLGAAETRAAIAAAQLATAASEKTQRNSTPLVQPDHGQPGRPGAPDDGRARQSTC